MTHYVYTIYVRTIYSEFYNVTLSFNIENNNLCFFEHKISILEGFLKDHVTDV